ncbi:MAG: glycosyltransferase [Acidobacteria bacterium]|nr:glycosyltransferase [Acidobacteriota bacterium]
MKAQPRVAFFTDSLHEINGVAHTSRQFVKFIKCRQLPLLCVNAGRRTKWNRDGPLTQMEIKRGRCALRLDDELRSDFLLWRHYQDVHKAVHDFAPDVIHITGPSDIGQLGAYVAHKLKIPLVASWHTNLHQYAVERFGRWLPFMKPQQIEACVLTLTLRFYQLARVLLAPNEELRELLQTRTGKPTFLMQRGIETETFSPAHRLRLDSKFKLGYVGRLRPEKNLRALVRVEEALLKTGINDYQFIIIGSGSEQEWLNQHLQHAVFTGNLTGQSLIRSYANFDLFVFPSQTDAFGNVVLEALASGVPAVVMNSGGPKFIVESEKSGFVAQDEKDFAETVVRVMRELANPERKHQLREAARARALCFAWSRVFEQVYEAYDTCLSTQQVLAVEANKSNTISTSTSTMSKS